MGHIDGTSRAQPILFPEVLDGSIAAAHPVRCIDAFVDSLDLHALGCRRTPPPATGRPAYAPGDFLKLYISGYMHRLRSSRRLEKETPRHVELLGFLRKLPPDFTTIVVLRKDNATAFKQVFRAFVLLGKEWGLCGQALVAIDGTKLKAVNSKPRNCTPAKLRETLQRIEAPREQYLRDLDMADAAETESQKPTAETLREKIRHLRERQGRYEGLLREMERTARVRGH
jgi:transposase